MKTKHYIRSLVAFIVTALMVFVSCDKETPTTITEISLNENVISLVVGTSGTLTASIDPPASTSVVWSSANEEVATVEEGRIVAVAPGKTVVSAKIGNNTAFCDVIVTAVVVPVEGISLDRATMELAIGAIGQLTFEFTPEEVTNRKVIWNSSDEEIATIDEDGIVIAIAPGEAIITITTDDGNHTAECVVTVLTVAVEEVTLDRTTLDMWPGSTGQLTAQISPADATIKTVTWSSSNEAVATVDEDGEVTAVANGEAIITATSVDDPTKTAQCTITVAAPPVTLIIKSVGAGITDAVLSNGNTQFKGTIGSSGVAFHVTAPVGEEISTEASILKFEYKLAGHQIPVAQWVRVYMYHPEVPTAWGITEDYSVVNQAAIPTVNDWTPYELDFTPIIDKLQDKRYNHDPNFFDADMFQFRLNSFDNQDRVWEIRNIRLEKR